MTLARCISCFCGVPWPERVQTEKRSLLKISIRFTTHLYIEGRLFKTDQFSKWRLQCRHSSGLPETRTRVFISGKVAAFQSTSAIESEDRRRVYTAEKHGTDQKTEQLA